MKSKILRRTIALGVFAAAIAVCLSLDNNLSRKDGASLDVSTTEAPVTSVSLGGLFPVPVAAAGEENSGEVETPKIEAAGWGKIRGIELTAPIASLTAEELLAVSLGSMHEDIVRDGLPWFDAVRDDFKNKPRRHRGLDFYGENLPIIAMADGTITVRSNAKNAGYYVVIDHGGGVETLYMHLKEPYNGPNRVERGDLLGITGISGNAISPQLHLGIRVDKVYIDPTSPLKEAADTGTRDLIAYYESQFEVKSRARKHLVTAYLADDADVKRAETEKGLELLRTISYDEKVSEWLKRLDGK